MKILKYVCDAVFDMFIYVISLWILISFMLSHRDNFLLYVIGSGPTITLINASRAMAKKHSQNKFFQVAWFIIVNSAVALLAWYFGYFKMELTWLGR